MPNGAAAFKAAVSADSTTRAGSDKGSRPLPGLSRRDTDTPSRPVDHIRRAMPRGGRLGDTVAPVSSAARHPIADEAHGAGFTEPSAPAHTAATSTVARPEASRVHRTGRLRGPLRRLGHWFQAPAAFDTALCVVYLCFALWLSRGLWPDPATRAIADNVNDQALIEWFLAHGVLVWRGDFSFVTTRLNSPDGVNLMSNASHILHGVIMAPVTVLFGAAVSFALLVALNLAATAAGWYLLLARGLRLNRAGALIGGVVAGFAPGMISQSHSHLHMTAQWLVPPIVWCVIRLTRVTTLRAITATALGLAALLGAQLLLGEEVLFLTVFTLALYSVVYGILRWRWTLRILYHFGLGLWITAATCVVLFAYPLWVQLNGPQHTPNAPFAPRYFFADLATYALFSPLSIAGSAEAGKLSTSAAEYNTYLGLPLLLVLLGCAVWRWRSPVVLATTVTGLLVAYLSLGPHVTLNGTQTGWPSLYGKMADVPLLNGALPTRYALALIPLIGLLLAVAVDAAVQAGGVARIAVPTVVVAALLPTMPIPLATTDRAPVPTFITSGAWRQCTPEGGVLVPVPLPTPTQPDAMRWPAAADAAFAVPEGFFIGPYGPGGRSSIGTYKQPTSALLEDVAKSGVVPPITNDQRAQARRDLEFWKADCVALAHGPHETALRATLNQLLGPGTPIEDTWTWKVR